jgi:hypothetical protein
MLLLCFFRFDFVLFELFSKLMFVFFLRFMILFFLRFCFCSFYIFLMFLFFLSLWFCSVYVSVLFMILFFLRFCFCFCFCFCSVYLYVSVSVWKRRPWGLTNDRWRPTCPLRFSWVGTWQKFNENFTIVNSAINMNNMKLIPVCCLASKLRNRWGYSLLPYGQLFEHFLVFENCSSQIT